MREPGVGDTIDGRYILRRQIARGGMGAVYEAEQHITGQIVALKLLSGDVLHVREAQERLLREARAISKARHRGIVRILDAGICETTGPYLALERLRGRTLDGILAARGALPIEDAVHVVRKLCEALSFVHGRGVVHRDLKPQNVFIAIEDGVETVKLFDFGIAALIDSKTGPRSLEKTELKKLTQETEVLGTPEYMAPEQLFLDEVDHRCDIWAAGITLFECLTGDVPYTGTYAEVVQALATRKKRPSLTQLRPDAPPGLEEVMLKAIAFRAADRFPNAIEFRDALSEAAGLDRDSTRLFQSGIHMRSIIPSEPPAEDGDRESVPIPLVRRQYERAPFQSTVALRLEDGSEVRVQADNICEGGLLVHSDRTLPRDTPVSVRFTLPAERNETTTIEARAQTRWVRRTGKHPAIGLEFDELPDDARSLIADYVRAAGGDG